MLGQRASLSTRVASLHCRTTRHTASLASGRHCPSWVHSPPVSVRLALANAAELADAVVNKNLVAQWITSWACPAVACARTATAQRCPQAQPGWVSREHSSDPMLRTVGDTVVAFSERVLHTTPVTDAPVSREHTGREPARRQTWGGTIGPPVQYGTSRHVRYSPLPRGPSVGMDVSTPPDTSRSHAVVSYHLRPWARWPTYRCRLPGRAASLIRLRDLTLSRASCRRLPRPTRLA